MEQITLVEKSIHRPDEPRHFMEFTYPAVRYIAMIGDRPVAESAKVLKLSEVGYHIYDPVLYFPLTDARLDLLRASARTSHCPLKGDTHYYDFVDGDSAIADVGWCYSAPLDFARPLEDYVAFDGRRVRVIAQS
jgi:uncharacterized protein (DUF427 family)